MLCLPWQRAHDQRYCIWAFRDLSRYFLSLGNNFCLNSGQQWKALKVQHPIVSPRNILSIRSLGSGDASYVVDKYPLSILIQQRQHGSQLSSDRMYQLDPLGVGLNETDQYATALPLLSCFL